MRKHHYLSLFLVLVFVVAGLTVVSAQTVTPTLTPFVGTPYVFPTATPAFCQPPLALIAGSTAFIRPGANIRSQPTLNSALVNYRDSSTTVVITGGPICADGLNWWQVRAPGEDGWVAENFNNVTLLVPGPPDLSQSCPEPLTLPVGTVLPLVSGGVRVRAEPGLSSLVLTVGLMGTEVTIMGDPVCADRLNWFPVQLVSVGVTYQGWMAEGFEGHRVVEEPISTDSVCAPPIRLSNGTRAYVNSNDPDPKNLRSEPGRDAPVLFTLIDGIGFTVIGGPVCTDGLNWWNIQILSRPDVVGWFAEGGPGNYWIRRIQSRELK